MTVAQAQTTNGIASTDERALVNRLLAGDEAAFTYVVERYHGPLIRFALLFVATRAVAEEVVQDTWVAVLHGLPAFEGRSALKSWIFGILANRAKTRAVREKRTIAFSELSAPGDEDEPAVDPDRFTSAGGWSAPPGRWEQDTPEKLLLHRESLAVIEKAMAALPASQRAVVTLRDVEGLDAAEVCNVLDVSETNQRVLLHRGRSKVRAALERYMAES
ncbi:MAG: sigma-70 family RNA polymerase sigma factor [Acidobacteria bacterium]|nr:sigma-70 family RNA polymerase sigma factor [Acidobacteriota bacterium]